MFVSFIQKVFGSANERTIKKLKPQIEAINALEPDLQKLSDTELKARTGWFKERLAKGESLDTLLEEAFATVREASKRIMNMRHFDVQLMGGIMLHKGNVIEMATGEGKTLIATLPAYLNALEGKGVHVVTVNDYLAQRDANWMGKIYEFLGLSVGCIQHELSDAERQDAYNRDITYVTNNELGFDYLRDNMKFRLSDMAQRSFNYAIVDEVDSILIDEARTPLIISGPAEDSSELYQQVNTLIPQLTATDYEKEEKSRSVTLTEQGSQRIEQLLENIGLLKGGSLYEIQNISLVHHVNQALRAHKLFTKDVDYMVKDDKVIIIDEFTGRMMEGRRYSEGLHQALEAKERVSIQMENQTLASITFQNLFRIYSKLSGMTGTAKTEAAEFSDIYKLDVVQIPTNLPMSRQDLDDEVYRTATEKYNAIITLIEECRQKKQPILVGTTSIEKSELISTLLKQRKIPHQVLNARYHEQEAVIVAQAGRSGAITIATNMAGRGTDIKLGGNLEMRLSQELENVTDAKERERLTQKIREELLQAEQEVKAAGGLYVIGTERHESRRIDNQLRGRAGRQGDPGKSKFFLSLEDDLMRIFGSDRLDNMLQKLGLEEGEAIIHPWINKALERAQQKVEGRNYDIRKHLLKYDDVMNDQRKIIYEQRREMMETDDVSELVQHMREDVIDKLISTFIPANVYPDQWEVKGLHEECLRLFNLDLPLSEWAQEEGIADEALKQRIVNAVSEKLSAKETLYGTSMMHMAEKSILLRVLDQAWKDHLHGLDHLRQGINLRAYAQRDPLNEYKHEAFLMFQEMLSRAREMVVSALSHLELYQQTEEEIFEDAVEDLEEQNKKIKLGQSEFSEIKATKKAPQSLKSRLTDAKRKQKTLSSSGSSKEKKATSKKDAPKKSDEAAPTRNSLCPCGSGKRYKHCHGQDA
ncbi:MAG: preprotein translocase subunit SecA [Candidatus Paracaedimonas acanthamoebae]|uniref:Protein translocase subunit SecA n=1 Tax=Candidatus Paracaedimonas acanthamoebae TaxID=244581 RepID=A0A8J7TSN9_9PROT|nr:preprotein translocase subunit SecA [Candidatus Paracaedimonas acanthamoebae]